MKTFEAKCPDRRFELYPSGSSYELYVNGCGQSVVTVDRQTLERFA